MNRINLPARSELIAIIEESENLEEDRKNELFDIINDNYSDNYNLNQFKVERIKIMGNTGTLYKGVTIDFDHSKPITIIKGKNNTGKTMSFQKIKHFFTRYYSKSSTYKNLLTELQIILKSKNGKTQFKIDFHSQSGYRNNKRFKISKQVLNNKNIAKKDVVIDNPLKFLKEHFFINYNQNETMFLSELPGHSFVNTFCLDEIQFRKLYRIQFVDKLYDKIDIWRESLQEKIDENQSILRSLKTRRENIEHRLENFRKDKEYTENFIDMSQELLHAKQIYDQFSINLRKLDETRIKKIRGYQKKIKNKQMELKKITPFNLNHMEDKYEALYQIISSSCFECNTIIPIEKFKDRVEKSKCFICGIGQKSYQSRFKILPEKYGDNAIEEKAKLKGEIENLKQKLKSVNEQEKLIKKPTEIEQKVWDEMLYFPTIEDLSNEIANAKELIESYNNKIPTYKGHLEDTLNQISGYENKLEFMKNQISHVEDLKSKFIEFEESKYQRFKKVIFLYANRFLMSFLDTKIGKLAFNENEKLIVLNSMYKDNDMKDFKEEKTLYNDLSVGTKSKVELSFALAFLSLNQKFCIRPLGLLFIDGLNFLEANLFENLYNILKEKFDYQLVIFTTEISKNIDNENIKLIKMRRNPLLRELDTSKKINQLKLDVFF